LGNLSTPKTVQKLQMALHAKAKAEAGEGTKVQPAVWRKRWHNLVFELGMASPFGRTTLGMEDYRGLSLQLRTLKGAKLQNADLSCANFERVRLEDCTITGCAFDAAQLGHFVAERCCFEDCSFLKADMRLAQIGFGGTSFHNCNFEGVKLQKTGFLNVTFCNVAFQGSDWSHVDFGPASFQNCVFQGEFRDVVFRGEYLYPSQREIGGDVISAGLHRVSFAGAHLAWVAAYNGCDFKEIILPIDGSSFIVESDRILDFYSNLHRSSVLKGCLAEYFRVIRPDPSAQKKQFVNRADIISIFGEEQGGTSYDMLKLELISA
jgi:uncharacterized protein YjbI with pentapeptide repeats